jgi:segregation and condensation protein B
METIKQWETEELSKVVEALLFSSSKPLSLGELVRLTHSKAKDIVAAISALENRLSNSGLMLQRHADLVQIVTRPLAAPYVAELHGMKSGPRISKAAYETLAIVAYRQPITKHEIDKIRGSNSSTVIDTLIERDLITCVGRAKRPGRPLLYGTTLKFLQLLGISSLDQLPPVEQIIARANEGNE